MKRCLDRSAGDSQQGAAAVEFALVLPLLLVLIFGMVDFARAYNARISLSGGAREGARVLALGSGNPEEATKNGAPSIAFDDITVTMYVNGVEVTDPAACSANAGAPARVTASYDFMYITPISGLVELIGGSALASPITLTGIGVMRCGG